MKQVEKLLKDSADEFDKSFKAFEEIQKESKKTEISNEFNTRNQHQFINFYDFFEPQMLNKGTAMKSIIERMDDFLTKIENDLNIINSFDAEGETLQYYIQHKDLSKAMEQKKVADENKRIAEEMKLKREEEQKAQEEQFKQEQEREALDEVDAEEEFEFIDIFDNVQEQEDENAMKLKEEIEAKEKKLKAIQDEIDRLENIKRDFYTEIEELKQELNRKLGV
jgi:archaellum component FlaC